MSSIGRQELLHRVAGEGLSVDYAFSRQPFSGDPHMVSLHIYFSNNSETPIKGLHVGTPKLPAGISIQEFPEIGTGGLGQGRGGGPWADSVYLSLLLPSWDQGLCYKETEVASNMTQHHARQDGLGNKQVPIREGL